MEKAAKNAETHNGLTIVIPTDFVKACVHFVVAIGVLLMLVLGLSKLK